MKFSNCHPARKHWAKGLCRLCYKQQISKERYKNPIVRKACIKYATKYNMLHYGKFMDSVVRYQRKKFKTDPSYRIKCCLYSRLYHIISKQNTVKAQSTLKLLGCEIETLREHLEKGFKSGMTWNNHGEWHIDHIKPCSSFDLTKLKEQQKCFHFTNLQPLWARENQIKGNK